MTGTGDLAAVIRKIADDPAILGLGDLYVNNSWLRASAASLMLRHPAKSDYYVVDLQIGPTDDRQLIRLVERWAAERKRHSGRRVVAVLVAGDVGDRYVNILEVIAGAVPIVAVEMQMSEAAAASAPRFRPVRLRLR